MYMTHESTGTEGHHDTPPSTETVGEGSRRKDHDKRRRWLQGITASVHAGRGEKQQTGYPETDGRG